MKRMLCLMLALALMLPALALGESAPDPVEDVIALLSAEDGAEALLARMHPDLQAAMTADAIRSIWPQLTALGGEFTGLRADEARAEASGYTVYTRTLDFERASLSCQLTLDGEGLICGLTFSPVEQETASAAVPEGIVAEEVTVGEEPWLLSGTLTLPADCEGPVPAVVLVQGSGPSDRDETVGAVAPFRNLAEMLTQQGIAVIRYDKRTYVYGQEIASSEDFAAFTVEEETIQDAIAAGRLLAEDPRIDASRIFVLGHSLGAMLAPRIADESDGLFCGMILACGTNRSLMEIILRQNEDAIAAMPEDQQAAYLPMLEEARAQLEQLPALDGETAKAMTILGQPGYYFWDMAVRPSTADYLTQLQLPALIINGSRDFQITEEEGRQTWEAVLPMDAPWLTTLWNDVNHMLMKPEVDASAAGTAMEYYVPCTVDAETAGVIADFILTTEETNP
ncbi:MAG: alpha/beta fold hydrolase [Aristaeellaceae bacterium]